MNLPLGFQRRRQLRRAATDAERHLWRLLRDRQLSGAKFRRQHPCGPYILDFYCPEKRLAVEADGGQHLTAEGIARDAQRTRYLAGRGVRVLRFSDREILLETQEVLQAIFSALIGESTRDNPRPDPLLCPKGDGGALG